MEPESRSAFDVPLDKAPSSGRPPSLRALALATTLVVALAFIVRSLYAVDQSTVLYTTKQPGTRMAARYDAAATGILDGAGVLFPRARPEPRDTGLLARPPGYPLWLAAVYRVLGHSYFAAQAAQNVLNSLACGLLTIFVARLVSFGVGIAGGVLAAISPQLGYTSNLVLADSIAAVPMLVAISLVADTTKRPVPCWRAGLAGLIVGFGAWLRPNVALLGIFMLPFLVIASRDRRPALPRAAILAVCSFVAIAPITIRNWIVFHEFVPISINGGITLWQGVAEAGGAESGARKRDKLVIAEEAERYGEPRYAEWWASPDGIARDRDRFRRAWSVIGAHPAAYARAMARRMGEMLSYGSAPAPSVARAAGPSSPPPAVADVEEGGGTAAPAIPAANLPHAWLAPGHAFAGLRGAIRAVQAAAKLATLPLLCGGALMLLATVPRAAVLLAAVPAYYLIMESMFLYEWRVAAPMHYFLLAFAAGPWIGIGRFLLRRVAQKAAGRQVTR